MPDDSSDKNKNTQDKILSLITENPHITIANMSSRLQISTRAIEKQLANLKSCKKLTREGNKKNGYWKITE